MHFSPTSKVAAARIDLLRFMIMLMLVDVCSHIDSLQIELCCLVLPRIVSLLSSVVYSVPEIARDPAAAVLLPPRMLDVGLAGIPQSRLS